MLVAIEDAIIEQVDNTLPNLLRETGSLGGYWSVDTLRRALQFAPAVYVSFLGGRAIEDNEARIQARFDVYVVTKEPKEPNRRRGGRRSIGAYEIVQRMTPVLHGLVIPDIGTLILRNIANLFQEAALNLGGTVYAMTFSIPLCFDLADPDNLGDFLKFHADYDAAATSEAYVQATATLTIQGGAITGVTITQSGAGYTQAPEIKLYGPGTGATLQAQITNGQVTGVNVVGGGSGYTDESVIAITYPPGGQIDAQDDVTLPGP